MGNQVVIAKAAAGVASDYWVHDLPRGVVLKDVLAPGRFLKTLDCFHHEGRVIVKVFLKRADLALPLQASHPRCHFRAYEQQLKVIRHRLSGIHKSHVWPFQKWYETERAAYVLRQYLFSTLHDRLGTRPFLGLTFKNWIAFQILKALDQAHSRGVCHGDLKADNVCVTAWNWVFVVDWAPFKPVLVPKDNPAIFSFFFDTAPSGRRRCCIAPERFVSASEWRQRQSEGEGGVGGAQLQPAMDIFSAGCVIAEMFLDGDVLFDLSSLLAYVHGSYDPLPLIHRIPCPSVRALVAHMVQRDPSQRLPAAAYLTAFSDPHGGALFPQPAFDALHDHLFCHLPSMDADGRIALTRQLYPRLSRIIASSLQGGGEGDADGKGEEEGTGEKGSAGEAERGESGVWGKGGGEQGGEQEVAVEGGVEGSGELRGDEGAGRSEQVPSSAREKDNGSQQRSSSTGCDVGAVDSTGGDGMGTGIIPGTQIGEGAGRAESAEGATKPGRGSTGARGSASESTGGGVGNSGSTMVLLVGLLTACLRNARLPHSRRHCLLLLHAAAHHCSHAVCLQAVAPFLVAVLAPDGLTATPLHALDTLLPGGAASPPLVRCTALTVLTRLLERVRSFPSTDARFFPEYLFPSLSLLPRSPDESVRATLALCLPSLAASALRFLLLAAGATRTTGGSEGESGQGASEGERKGSSTAWKEWGGGETDGDVHQQRPACGVLATSGLPPSQRVSSGATLTSLKALAAAAEGLPEQHMGEVAEVREAVRVAVEELSTLPRSTPPIRLSLLHHAPSLAVFLGPPLATTALLPLLITFLNDPSPRVRSAFFHTLPALCPHVAPSALPAFLLPCLEQALGDTSHSSVPAAAAACLAQLARSQRLQQRRWLLSAARHAAPLLRHPEGDVRGAAVAFAAAAASQLSAVDAHALLLPLLSPSLRYRPALLTSPASLAAALKAPLSAHPAVPPHPPLPAGAGVASWHMSAGQAAPDLRVPHVLSPAAARETEAGRATAAGAGVSADEHGSKRGVGARGGEEEQGADMGAVGRGEGGAADMQGKRLVGQEEGRDVAMGGQAASGRAAAAQHVALSTLAHSLSMQYAVPPTQGAAAAAPYPAMAAALASMRTDTGQPWPPLPSTAPWPATSHWPASTAPWPSTPLHTPLLASASHSLLVPPLPPLHPSISPLHPVRFPSPHPASSPLSLSLSFHRPPPPLTTHPPSSLTSSTTRQPLSSHSLAPIHLPLAPSLPSLPSPSSHASPHSPSASFSLAPATPHAQSHPALDLPALAVPLYSLAHPASAPPTAASTSALPSTTLSPPSLPRPPSALSPSASPTATLAAAAATAADAACAGGTGRATLDALAAAQAASAAAAAALPARASPSVPAAATSVSSSCSHATSLPAQAPSTPVVGACEQSPVAPAARSTHPHATHAPATHPPAPHLSSPTDLPFAFDSLDDLPSPSPTSAALPTSHSPSHPSLPPPTTPYSSTTPTSTPTPLPPSNALPPHTAPLLPHTLRGPPPAPAPPAPVSHSLVFLGTTQPHTRISSLSLSLRSSRRPPSSSALPPTTSPAPHTLPPAMPAAGPASMRAAEAGQGGRAEEEVNRRGSAAGREGHTAPLERPRALAGGDAACEVPARAASHAQSSVADRSAAHVNATSSATSASPHLVEPGGVRAGTTGHAQLPAAAQLAPPSAAGQAAGAEAEESRERRAAAVSSEVQRLLGWGSADDGAAMALPPASPSPLSTTAAAAAWRPRGVLVAQLHEHHAAVPALAVAPNSQWFATASHDGTVKVWDATRLDRGTAFRSKLTYAPQAGGTGGAGGGGGGVGGGAGRATAVAVMGDSARAAVGYASGEVHVVHVDYAPRFLSSPDSYRCITRMPSLEPSSPSSPSNHGPGASRGAILSVHSWAGSNLGATQPSLSASSSSLFSCNPLSSSHSLLLVASLHGGITLWDMRAARPAFSLHLHASLGAPTHVLPDPQHGLWLLGASSCSALCLWDLRFLLPLSSWRLPSAPSAPHPPPITALAPMLPAAFPPPGDAMGAAAAGGPEHLPGWFGADRGRGGTGGGAVGAAGGGAAAAGAAGAVGGASRPLVYVASGRDEVGLWSADTGQCHQVFSVAPQPSSNTASPPSLPSPSNLPTALQSRAHLLPLPPFSTSTTTPSGRTLSSSPCLPNGPLPQSTQSAQSSGASGARQARQSALRVEQLKEPPGRAGGVRALLGVPGGGALLTAGTDCCIRYWCRLRPEQSGWVSGPTARGARGEVLHPRYDMRIVHGARVIQETPPPFYVDATRQRGSGTGASTAEAGGRAAAGSQGHADTGPGGAAGGGGGGAGGGGRRSMVEVAAVDVGGCHRDAVLALAVADPGQRLLLSASRDGVVNVWR
ncbi:unnamed protein product [Closterium sp. Naga37s-1]|nr:unnamed protein product [Closterium sp. Naga37s-1]